VRIAMAPYHNCLSVAATVSVPVEQDDLR